MFAFLLLFLVVKGGSNSGFYEPLSVNTTTEVNYEPTKSVSSLSDASRPLQLLQLPKNGSEVVTMFEEFIAGKLKLPIQKKSFNEQHRLVFVAGLEGTGHHGMQAMFDVCMESKLCDAAGELSKTMQTFHSGAIRGLFSGADGPQAHAQVQKIFDLMTGITKQTRAERPAVVHIVGLGYSGPSGMMSYPNGHGPNKALDYPDIAVLAFLSELAGLDFRALVMQRPAIEVIASTRNRGFGGVMEPRILISNAQALYSQMTTIHPSFYHCLDYHTLGNMTEAHQVAFRHFVHPDIDDALLKKMFSKIRYEAPFNITNNLGLKKIGYDVFQLQMRTQLIDSLCEKQHKKMFSNSQTSIS